MQLKHNIWRKILKAGLVLTSQVLIPSTSMFAQACARRDQIETEVKKLQVEKKTVEKECKDEMKMKKRQYEDELKKLENECKTKKEALKKKYK